MKRQQSNRKKHQLLNAQGEGISTRAFEDGANSTASARNGERKDRAGGSRTATTWMERILVAIHSQSPFSAFDTSKSFNAAPSRARRTNHRKRDSGLTSLQAQPGYQKAPSCHSNSFVRNCAHSFAQFRSRLRKNGDCVSLVAPPTMRVAEPPVQPDSRG